MVMRILSYGISNVGMKRSQNEDSYLINDEMGLYMVADGMGGHQGGEFASKLAVTTVEDVIRSLRFDPDSTLIRGVNAGDSSAVDELRYAIKEASRCIHEQAMYDENLRGMGTTSVVALFVEPNFYIANVGDSRAYLFNNGVFKQVTEDHSLVTEQIRAGVLSVSDARGHRLKNIITRSVGYQEEVESDVICRTVLPGDRLLMCSDGLSNLVEDSEIGNIVASNDIQEACEMLVTAANSRGGDDNITVIILQVDDIP